MIGYQLGFIQTVHLYLAVPNQFKEEFTMVDNLKITAELRVFPLDSIEAMRTGSKNLFDIVVFERFYVFLAKGLL